MGLNLSIFCLVTFNIEAMSRISLNSNKNSLEVVFQLTPRTLRYVSLFPRESFTFVSSSTIIISVVLLWFDFINFRNWSLSYNLKLALP